MDKEVETAIYEELESNTVRCGVCPRRCTIKEGQSGFCRVRQNRGGKLVSLVYGRAVSYGVDPIEKKPLFHFAPGSRAFSIATMGCNLRCDFCQNFRISQEWKDIEGEDLPPKEAIKKAKMHDCDGIAYTYTEPTVFLEYAHDTMKSSESLYNVFVSNGYITEEAVDYVVPYLDAINVDLKGDADFYRRHCNVPDPEPIFDALKILSKRNILVEVTNLLIPGENDSEAHIRERVEWIMKNLGEDTPVHFSRFKPDYRMKNKKPTPISTLEKAIKIAENCGLNYVYSGNVPGHKSESTFCPNCGELVIKRHGFTVEEFKLKESMECHNCSEKIFIEGERWIPEKLFKG